MPTSVSVAPNLAFFRTPNMVFFGTSNLAFFGTPNLAFNRSDGFVASGNYTFRINSDGYEIIPIQQQQQEQQTATSGAINDIQDSPNEDESGILSFDFFHKLPLFSIY